MKARTSFMARQTAQQQREYSTWINILISCYALHKGFGFGTDRLNRFLDSYGDAVHEIADMEHGAVRNRTWQDELIAWAESMGIEAGK